MPSSKKPLSSALFVLPLTLVAAASAEAQTVVPPAADTARVIPNERRKPLDFDSVKQKSISSRKVALPQDAARVSFVLKSVDISGVTAYPAADIQALYAPQLGKTVTKADIYEIAQRLQDKYSEDGYTLSKVVLPDQNFKDGRIKIVVIEGYVAEVELKDGLRPAPIVDDLVRRIKAMRPLNTKTLERLMLVMNALPGTKMSSILATPKNPTLDPGAIRLVLESVPVNRATGMVNVNNYGSLFSGPFQYAGNVDIAHVALDYADLDLTVTAAQPLSELAFGSFKYSLPVFGASGAKLAFSGVAAHTEPGDTLKDLDLRGNTREARVEMSYPIWLQRDRSWFVDGGFRVNNARMEIAGDRLYDDKLRVLMLGTSLTYADSLLGVDALDVRIHQGLNAFGARETGSADLSRAEGRSDFTKFEATLGRRQALPGNFEAYCTVQGQYTNDPLMSSEEFGFGGAGVGRGYDPSEITGDRGVSASVELRYNHAMEKYQSVLQPYVFYDIGKVWNIDPGAEDQTSAASAGAGLRLSIKDDWAIESLIAVPLTRPADNPPHYTEPEGVRILFSVTKKF